jgi:sirohydrochlorin ferrochelatase
MTDRITSERCAIEKTAIILLGHGSRAMNASQDMETVVARLKMDSQFDIVEICQMSGLGEHFPEVFDRCVAAGASRIIVIPYFLHFGIHLRKDVPAMMMNKARQYPNVNVILGKHIGYDDALVTILRKRIAQSESLSDIRDIEMDTDDTPDIDIEDYGDNHNETNVRI